MAKFEWSRNVPLRSRDLRYRLVLVFGIFFFAPLIGFVYFALKYDLLNDDYTLLFLLGFLAFFLVGFTLLRRLFDEISLLARQLSDKVISRYRADPLTEPSSELQNIVQSFGAMEREFSRIHRRLEKKTAEVSILKELSDLCYVTFDPEEILYITLERALQATGSDIGSVLTLDRADPRSFTVKASIGLGDHVKTGDRIDFDTSIAKYAVINKSPLVVENVEKDSRFGRGNLSHYGTKSFVCMPIKTSREIVGVLTISRRDDNAAYSQEDVEALTPLVSNAAFTYENLRLLKENERTGGQLKAIEKIFRLINSSFRDSELLLALIAEMREVIPFDLAVVFTQHPHRPDHVRIFELWSSGKQRASKGASYPVGRTVLGSAMRREMPLVVEDPGLLAMPPFTDLVGEDISAAVLSPLKMDGKPTGLLLLGAVEPAAFRDRGELIGWMADMLAFGIERNALTAAVSKRDRELTSIRQIGSALASSTFDIRQVLKYTMDMIRMIMNVEAGSLLFLKKGELRFAVSFNTKVKTRMQRPLKLGQGIAGYVGAKGESIIVNDTSQSPHFFSAMDRSTGFKTRSALCVPMISQGRVIGVIEVLNKINGDFLPGDEDLLQSIASSVSIAIENARLYRETVSMADQERGIRRMFQKFVPEEIVDKIIHGSDSEKVLLEELRTLTLLNLDIRGFSMLARDIGTQKTVSLLNRFFSVMGGIVFKHSGIVDKYLGDGFLAIFGAPVSSTRDADNAISAAMEMRHSLPDLNRRFIDEIGASVQIGISIHTGEVVVGNIGFDKKMDYTVIGDAVNTVFRLQDLTHAFPDGILLSENTRKASRFSIAMTEIDTRLGDLRIFELSGSNIPAAAEVER
ncbi:MAG: GAF domain-containing protein [Desulfobacterales bacterium]